MAFSGPAPSQPRGQVRLCPYHPCWPEAPASCRPGSWSPPLPGRKQSTPPARLFFPDVVGCGTVLALPLVFMLPSSHLPTAPPHPEGCHFGVEGGGQGAEGAVCCENPGLGEQCEACQPGTSEILGQLPSYPPSLCRAEPRSLRRAEPGAGRSSSHISAQGAVLAAAECYLRESVCLRCTQSPTSRLTAFWKALLVLPSQTFL